MPEPAGRHDHHRQLETAGPGPALVAGHFEEVNCVETVVAELDLGHGPAAGVGDAHGAADDAALVERRIPGGLQPLRGGEDAAQRRADVLAEDVGDAEVFLAVVQGEADGLYQGGHATAVVKVSLCNPRGTPRPPGWARTCACTRRRPSAPARPAPPPAPPRPRCKLLRGSVLSSKGSRRPASTSFRSKNTIGSASFRTRWAPVDDEWPCSRENRRLQHVGLALPAAVVHGAADGVPAGDHVVAVHHLAGDAERPAPVDDVALAVLAGGSRRYSPTRYWSL